MSFQRGGKRLSGPLTEARELGLTARAKDDVSAGEFLLIGLGPRRSHPCKGKGELEIEQPSNGLQLTFKSFQSMKFK